MIKIVDPSGFNFDQPITSLVEVHSRGIDSGWLKKSAAVLTKELSDIRPEPGRTFMHLIALGDSEYYGSNRNGDIFPKQANEKYHDTFVKHANFYRHHKNKPHLGHTIYGNVKAAAHNPEMHRVELIISIDNEKAPDTIQKVAAGEDLKVSMACAVPYDVCSVCNHKASTTADYCDCLKKYATQMLSDGRVVGMINEQPKFFDISEVSRNADRIAFSLRKVASVTSHIFSADLADSLGITAPIEMLGGKLQKRAVFLSYLAQLESDMSGVQAGRCLAQPLGLSGSVPDSEVRPMLYHLKQANVLLPMEDFFKVVMGDQYLRIANDIPAAKAAMSGMFKSAARNPETFLSGLNNYEPLDKAVSNGISQLIKEAVAKGSLTDDGIKRRVASLVLTKRASVVQYNSVEITDAGRYLASEYAKYKFAFLEDKDPSVVKLGMLQNFS